MSPESSQEWSLSTDLGITLGTARCDTPTSPKKKLGGENEISVHGRNLKNFKKEHTEDKAAGNSAHEVALHVPLEAYALVLVI